MQAMRVYRLADGPNRCRFYLDGRRVTPGAFENAHFQRATDTYCSRMETRRDGSVIVREYHNIRRSR